MSKYLIIDPKLLLNKKQCRTIKKLDEQERAGYLEVKLYGMTGQAVSVYSREKATTHVSVLDNTVSSNDSFVPVESGFLAIAKVDDDALYMVDAAEKAVDNGRADVVEFASAVRHTLVGARIEFTDNTGKVIATVA